MKPVHKTILVSLIFSLLFLSSLTGAQTDEPTSSPGSQLAPGEASPPENGERQALSDFVDGMVQTQQREHQLGALTLAIVRNDEPWLTRGYGLADIESARPVTPDRTLFRIGSVSKTFTWTAVMMLTESGQIDLDTDVNEYLKSVRVDEEFGEPVTMRHLMHHRAGFEDTLRLFTVADDDPRNLAELLADHQPRRVFPPGKRTSYSNWGAALAALVVSDVSGRPYGQFLREEILEPLGMNDTTWQAPSKMDSQTRERLSAGYKRKHGAFVHQDYLQLGAYWPAGGMAATATDMARWMRFHLNGGQLEGTRLMTAETHARMWTRGFDDRPEAPDVSHGFQDRPYHGVRVLGHGGGTAAYLTNMVLVPELDLGIFLSHNSAHTRSLISQIPDLVIDHFRHHETVPVLAEQDHSENEALAELAGTYLSNRRVFSSFAAVLGAFNTTTVTPLSDDALSLTSGVEATYYRKVPDAPDVFESPSGDRIAFLRNRDGSVEALADPMGVHTAERTGWFDAPTTLLLATGLALLLALTTTLGFWRRFSRGLEVTPAGRLASGAAVIGVLSIFFLLVSFGFLAVGLADFDLSTMSENYPPMSMLFVHYAGWGVAAAAALMLLAQWPAWTTSGWGWVRRLHFLLFTIAMLFVAVQLWQWRIFGAPVV